MTKYYMTVINYRDKVVHAVEVYDADSYGYISRDKIFIELHGTYIRISDHAMKTPKPTDSNFIGCEISENMFFKLIWLNK